MQIKRKNYNNCNSVIRGCKNSGFYSSFFTGKRIFGIILLIIFCFVVKYCCIYGKAEKMNRYNYYSTASKFLCVGSALLLTVKLLQVFGALIPSFSKTALLFAEKTNDISFFGFLILSFLAFNGETVFYKKNKEFKKRKASVNLRRLVIFNFFMIFFKNSFTQFAASKSTATVGGALCKFFTALLLNIGTLSFVLFCACIWYAVRDRGNSRLFPFQLTSLIVSCAYFFVKFLNNSVNLGLRVFGDAINGFVLNSVATDSLCALQYAADIVMFIVMIKYFSVCAEKCDEEINSKRVRHSNSIYEDKGFGIDNFDELLIPDEKSEI